MGCIIAGFYGINVSTIKGSKELMDIVYPQLLADLVCFLNRYNTNYLIRYRKITYRYFCARIKSFDSNDFSLFICFSKDKY